MNKRVLVMGYGEVGKAIYKAEEEAENKVEILELDKKPESTSFDVMNVCIPFSDKFIDIVTSAAKEYNASLIIIHSTVLPGTTKKIKRILKRPVVHSPVRGKHPNLFEGVKVFEKCIGGTQFDGNLGVRHLETLGINAHYSGPAKNTEFGKILDTTYYGWCILFAKQVNRLCKRFGLSYEEVYTVLNKSYNEGYTKLGMPHVVRPVLVPPTGLLGGHCVANNFELLPRCKLKRMAKKLNEEDNE